MLTLTLTLTLTPTLTPLTKVRDYVLELSMNANVQQALNHDELHAIFSEADVLRDACMRGGRAAGARPHPYPYPYPYPEPETETETEPEPEPSS